jgi:hypothetical protein
MNQKYLILALLLGAGLLAVSFWLVANQPTLVQDISAAITLSTTFLGFVLAVFGAVKSGLAVTESFGLTAADAVPSGVAAAVGGLLLIASRFIAG